MSSMRIKAADPVAGEAERHRALTPQKLLSALRIAQGAAGCNVRRLRRGGAAGSTSAGAAPGWGWRAITGEQEECCGGEHYRELRQDCAAEGLVDRGVDDHFEVHGSIVAQILAD